MKIAVFDVGNVLVRWDPRNLYAKIFTDPAEMEHFLAEVCTSAWNLRQDSGYPWDQAIAETTARFPRYAAEIAAFRGRWQETLAGPIRRNVALLDDLRAAGVPTYCITNFAPDTFRETQGLYPFLKGFNGLICSGDEGICKPDAAIYRLLLDRYGLKAEDCVFIDDSAANIAAAAQLGFGTVHYGLGIDARTAFRQLGFPV